MKPANLVLDLLRTYGKKGTTVQSLMLTASMFQISENAMRVTLSRLTQRGLIEKVSRGLYRLAGGSDPVNDFVEEWRKGESRRRAWQQNRFLIAQSNRFNEKDLWILRATGFRERTSGLWLRPDNLSRQGEALRQWLTGLGLSKHLLAENAELNKQDSDQVFRCYEIELLNASYRQQTEELTKSRDRLLSLPSDAAMIESFSIGGKTLQLLAKDPYLPEEIQASAEREQLWQIMLEYDELGRSVWRDKPMSLPADRTSYA